MEKSGWVFHASTPTTRKEQEVEAEVQTEKWGDLPVLHFHC